MRTSERMRKLKEWTEENLCRGRTMKIPGKNMDIADIVWGEPRCYIGWAPSRLDQTGTLREDPDSVVPSILIMPNQSYAKYMEEKRFDRYDNVHRPPDMGAHLSVTFLFSVYEPGVRLPGFVEAINKHGEKLDVSYLLKGTENSVIAGADGEPILPAVSGKYKDATAPDMSMILEGTEQGITTLMNWMDDLMEKLLGRKFIPHTDLFVEESTMTYSLYTDQNYVVDRRPLYYGFVNVVFGCYAEQEANPEIIKNLL